MKTMKFYMGISLLAALLLFSGCGKELDELPAGGSNTESPESPEQTEGEQLRLRVSDAGYLDAGTGSRATDSGLSTTFEEGDKIGLFVVNNEDEVLYANVPYTKSGKEWTTSQNVRTKGYPVRVFAYYPYVEDAEIVEKINKEAQDASAFFKTYIDALDITDQSTPELYRQADVMACMVEIEDKDVARKELTLTMNHLMGLVVVNLPNTVTITEIYYHLKEQENFSWKIVKEQELPANLTEKTISILALERPEGYRYLYKPSSSISFYGGFTTYASEKRYDVNNDMTLSSGVCKTYNISVNPFASTASLEYIPKAGDFYMNDGSVLSEISDNDKSKCVGVVFWVGNPTSYDPVLRRKFQNCIHGIVLSLGETTSEWLKEKDDKITIASWAEQQSFYLVGGYITMINDGNIQGYNNTNIMKEYDKYDKETNEGKYHLTILDCFNQIIGSTVLPEGRTSSWYLLSANELLQLFYNKVLVNKSLQKLGRTEVASAFYWSSSELNAINIRFVNLSNGTFWGGTTGYNHKVRLAFAF